MQWSARDDVAYLDAPNAKAGADARLRALLHAGRSQRALILERISTFPDYLDRDREGTAISRGILHSSRATGR